MRNCSISWKTGVSEWLMPNWLVPANVHAVFTTRVGGFSKGPYAGLNVGLHVGDKRALVLKNRQALAQKLPVEPTWLDQVHSNRCLLIGSSAVDDNKADAAVTDQKNRVLAVMVADCLPILLSELNGHGVAVIHAGWKGLANGVIASTLKNLQGEWAAWLGPAIGPCHYEVGLDVRQQFQSDIGFSVRGDRWMMDLKQIARVQLERGGVRRISGAEECTFCLPEKYYSHRRDGVTGRMAGFIWFD